MLPRRLATALVFATGLWLGCHDDDDVEAECEGGHCVCDGDDCMCPASGKCDIECTADCHLECTGSGSCAFVCADGCFVECSGSGECVLDVGATSSIRCTGSGNCDIVCHGPCFADCPGTGSCTLACDGDGLDGPLQCGALLACGVCP